TAAGAPEPAVRWCSLRRRPGSRRQRAQLALLRDHLVVGVAELVAPRAIVLAAELVDSDLDRRAHERGHELSVVDEVGLRKPQVARIGDVAGEAWEPGLLADVSDLQHSLVLPELPRNIARLHGAVRLAGGGLSRGAVDDLPLLARHVVLEPYGLLDEDLLQL